MEESWLSDKGIINMEEIQYGKMNIIEAPCGCGKTTFVERKLWEEAYWGDLLYLIDSKNALDAFKLRGEKKEYKGKTYYKHKGITAMTYATFAVLCLYKSDRWLWNDKASLIICDELQSVIRWAKIRPQYPEQELDFNPHRAALAELHMRIKIGARVVAISATPNSIREEFKQEYVDVPIHGTLRRYHAEKTIKFNNLETLVSYLPDDQRGVIYTPQITQMQKIQEQLGKREIKAVGFWSDNNFSYEMDDEEWDTRNSVIQNGIIPDDVQVLLINAASETGINITSPVDYVVVNDSNPDTQTQAVGRVRHDIKTAYLRDVTVRECALLPIGTVKFEWLGCRLYEEDKQAICKELNLRDSRGRPYGWTNVKKSLKFSGYFVEDKQEKNGRRYSIIN